MLNTTVAKSGDFPKIKLMFQNVNFGENGLYLEVNPERLASPEVDNDFLIDFDFFLTHEQHFQPNHLVRVHFAFHRINVSEGGQGLLVYLIHS